MTGPPPRIHGRRLARALWRRRRLEGRRVAYVGVQNVQAPGFRGCGWRLSFCHFDSCAEKVKVIFGTLGRWEG